MIDLSLVFTFLFACMYLVIEAWVSMINAGYKHILHCSVHEPRAVCRPLKRSPSTWQAEIRLGRNANKIFMLGLRMGVPEARSKT